MALSLVNIGLVVVGLIVGRVAAAVASPAPHQSTCRNIPGDARWPKSAEWDRLNATVDGRLIATVPIAQVCHDPTFSPEECAQVEGQWNAAIVMTTRPAEIMTPWFQNQSCVAFSDRSTPCDLGNYASYSIRVSNADDVVAGIGFARKNNIRLVVKNTGHDFFGKSTGKGALSLWTRNLQHKELVQHYNTSYYRGPAIKIGAGVNGKETAEFAAQYGYRFVVGSCPTVGVAGGYTQGGGHSFLSGLYGLGADNVLEWEVVTPTGERLVATPTKNSNLYWALSGGGGGTYGVVISMTSRVFSDGQIALASLSFNTTTVGGDDPFWASVGVLLSQLQPLVDDHGAVAQVSMTHSTFSIFGLMVPGADTHDLANLLAPLLTALSQTNSALTSSALSLVITHNSTYAGLVAANVEAVTEAITLPPVIGGRFISRSNWANNATAILAALRSTMANERFVVALTALNTQSALRLARPIAPNAAPPAFASVYLSLIVTSVWDWHRSWADAAPLQAEYLEVIRPTLEAVTPGAGAYGNEANWQQPAWQNVFYGPTYERLKGIKARYDPEGLLYGLTAVGSENWAADGQGRLCRK
ncbi:hypothetical protein B0J18DRAFT_441027 [Chaetomium sp. MPI-SDFR-AT-0129]|nr:hypothetical protein B0J18DRAFT_441027 [Chaetomium sp. MPI-SDFR-AT-0129]